MTYGLTDRHTLVVVKSLPRLKSTVSFEICSLVLLFGQVEAEISKVKDTRGHSQFSHNCARFLLVLEVGITLLDFKNPIGYLAIFSVIFSTQMTQLLTKRNKRIVEITQKNGLKLHKNVKIEKDPWCL